MRDHKAAELQRKLLAALSNGAMIEIDSAGMQLLLAAQHGMAGADGALTIAAPNSPVRT
jgi:ABC-type transporter Mla MlaB component